MVIARQDENGYNFSGSCCSSNGFVTHVLEHTKLYV